MEERLLKIFDYFINELDKELGLIHSSSKKNISGLAQNSQKLIDKLKITNEKYKNLINQELVKPENSDISQKVLEENKSYLTNKMTAVIAKHAKRLLT